MNALLKEKEWDQIPPAVIAKLIKCMQRHLRDVMLQGSSIIMLCCVFFHL